MTESPFSHLSFLPYSYPYTKIQQWGLGMHCRFPYVCYLHHIEKQSRIQIPIGAVHSLFFFGSATKYKLYKKYFYLNVQRVPKMRLV